MSHFQSTVDLQTLGDASQRTETPVSPSSPSPLNLSAERPAHWFPPGKSANPGGRPKNVFDLQLRCRTAAPQVFQKVLDWAMSNDFRASLPACRMILASAFHNFEKATAEMGAVPPGFENLSVAERIEVLKQRRAELKQVEADAAKAAALPVATQAQPDTPAVATLQTGVAAPVVLPTLQKPLPVVAAPIQRATLQTSAGHAQPDACIVKLNTSNDAGNTLTLQSSVAADTGSTEKALNKHPFCALDVKPTPHLQGSGDSCKVEVCKVEAGKKVAKRLPKINAKKVYKTSCKVKRGGK